MLLVIISVACVACAESRHLDPLSMNAASYLTPSQEADLKMSAKNGDVKAAKRLAWFYSEGLGDDREAVKWLRIAAEGGDLESEYNYAMTLVAIESKPSVLTESEARKWIEKAAAGGYKPAKETLAQLNRGEKVW